MQQKSLILLITLFFLSSCNALFKTNYSNILQADDFKKNCSQLEQSINDIENKQKKIRNKKRLYNTKNIMLYVIALPTAFMSLFFLDSVEEVKDESDILDYRLEHLKDLYSVNDCQKT